MTEKKPDAEKRAEAIRAYQDGIKKGIEDIVNDPSGTRPLLSKTLRGQKFLGNTKVYDNPEDLACGTSVLRSCDLCFYRYFEGNPDYDCRIAGGTAKTDFGLKPEEFLPTRLDGKEVGEYCRYFLCFDAE